MKSINNLVVVLSLAGADLCHAQHHTNTITTPGGIYAFSVNGSPPTNPTIELQAGVTNILNIQTDGNHPVVITGSIDTEDWFTDAAPQDVNSAPIALTTPSSGFPATLYYMCYFHGFYGEIHLTGPASPMPPANTILLVRVGTNIVMTSTGTNTTWLLVPEFSSNLLSGTWAPVPGYTNSFANGTNTTVFDRLDPICGPNVFLRIRQQQN
jgi:hypothetical protein